MSDGIYAFRRGPTYDGATQQELFDSVMAQPMGIGATLFDQAWGTVLGSNAVGTFVRSVQLPEEAPTVPGLIVTGEDGNTTRLPDSPNTRRMRTIWGDLPNVQDDTAELQARRDAAGALDEAAYRSSPYFRNDIPWDAGMTEDRAAALAEMYDARKVREHYATKRPIIAFLGQLAGQFADPLNYVPILGPLTKAAAVARLGKFGGGVLFSAADAAANTAIFSVATAGIRQKFGDDVSWKAIGKQISDDAMMAAGFGVAGGVFGKAVDYRAKARHKVEQQRLMTLRASQEARIALNEAIDGLARGEDIRLSPNATEPVARIAAKVEGLSRASDGVPNKPSGPVDDPLARIEPGDIDAQIVARGAFSKIKALEFSGSGEGPVKVTWAHGRKSTKDKKSAKALRVTRDDLAALPDIVRGYEPIPPDGVAAVGDAPMRTWRVERNGRVVVYTDKGFDGGQQHVTVHIEKGGTDAAKLSEMKTPAAPETQTQLVGLTQDVAGDRSLGTVAAGQAATPSSSQGRQLPAAASSARRPNIDTSVARPEPRPAGIEQAEAAVARTETLGAEGRRGESPRSENLRGLAEHHGVDPDSGAFAELAEITRLAAQGRLSQGDAEALADAQSDFEAGAAFAEALKSVARCLT